MTKTRKFLLILLALLLVAALVVWFVLQPTKGEYTVDELSGPRPVLAEPDKERFPSMGLVEPLGWAAGQTPVAAQGFQVTAFAGGLNHPRTFITLENGDVLVAETNSPAKKKSGGIKDKIMGLLMLKVGAGGDSPNTLKLLRDGDGDGRAEEVFTYRTGLSSPFGMGLATIEGEERLLVANHDALLSFPYTPGATKLEGDPVKLMDLPAGGNHWARNLAVSPDGSKVYVSVGSATNIADKGMDLETGRAAIHEYDLATGRQRLFAGGMRNPNGMDFNPGSGELWTVVNERDMLGPDVPPDYLTDVPLGGHYGWPWVYYKDVLDERVEHPFPQYTLDYVRKPQYALGAHTAPLGLAFAKAGNLMGAKFADGAFIARHGSWNRVPLVGYDVVFVPFDARGNVTDAKPVPVLGGFLAKDREGSHGRPVWTGFAKDGALLVSDDTGGMIWRVVAPGATPAPAPAKVKSAATDGKIVIPKVIVDKMKSDLLDRQ